MSSNVLTKRILILAANPQGTDKLRLDKEARDIKEGLRLAREREQFIIDSEWAVRPKDIRRAILYCKPEIVHFSGHGEADGGLAFENEVGQVKLVHPEALAGLFKLFSEHVKCVILNACYSELQSKAIAQHIDFVIGMNKAIGDLAAIEFAVGFYDALGAGCPVEKAYEFGCNAIQIAGIQESLTPVLQRKQDMSPPSQPGSVSCVPDSLTRPIKSKSAKVIYEFVLTGSVNEVSKQKLEAVVAHLREITGDASLTLLEIKPGSIRLILEGSEEGLRLLEELMSSGELNQVLEIPTLEIRRAAPPAESFMEQSFPQSRKRSSAKDYVGSRDAVRETHPKKANHQQLTTERRSQNPQMLLQEAINEARTIGNQYGASSAECAAAWDVVEELQAEASHLREAPKSSLEQYCDNNPEADECRVYDD